MKTPSELYQPSQHAYKPKGKEPTYPQDYQVRRVRSNGQIKWGGKKRFISEPLIGRLVGIKTVQDGLHQVYFGPILLGDLLDAESGGLRPTVSVPRTQVVQQSKSVNHVPG